jgi:hypothetical protein
MNAIAFVVSIFDKCDRGKEVAGHAIFHYEYNKQVNKNNCNNFKES